MLHRIPSRLIGNWWLQYNIGDIALLGVDVSGGHNVAIGYYALGVTTSGNNNVGIGQNTLAYNTSAESNDNIGQYALHRTGQYVAWSF